MEDERGVFFAGDGTIGEEIPPDSGHTLHRPSTIPPSRRAAQFSHQQTGRTSVAGSQAPKVKLERSVSRRNGFLEKYEDPPDDFMSKIQADVFGITLPRHTRKRRATVHSKEHDEAAVRSTLELRDMAVKRNLALSKLNIVWTRLFAVMSTSLWTWPLFSLIVNYLIGLAVSRVDSSGTAEEVGVLWYSTPGEAGQAFRFVASMVMGLTGTVFSLGIVAFQVAAVTYSPRVLTDLMRKKATKIVLSVFLGCFSYAYAGVMTTVAVQEDEFVPVFMVNLMLIYVFAVIIALVYYLDFVVRSLSVAKLLDDIAENVLKSASATTIRVEEDDGDDHDNLAKLSEDDPKLDFEEEDIDKYVRLPTVPAHVAYTIHSSSSGYLLQLIQRSCAFVADSHQVTIRFRARLGEYVTTDTLLAWVWRHGAELEIKEHEELDPDSPFLIGRDELNLIRRRVNFCLSIGPRRSIKQDIGFGLRQLMEIAVKGLSPGSLDPSTSCESVDRMERVLVVLAKLRRDHLIITTGTLRETPWYKAIKNDPQNFTKGRILVAMPRLHFPELLNSVINPVRWHGRTYVPVIRRQLYLLGAVGGIVARYGDRMATRMAGITAHIEDIVNSSADAMGRNTVEFESVLYAAEHAYFIIHGGKSDQVRAYSESESGSGGDLIFGAPTVRSSPPRSVDLESILGEGFDAEDLRASDTFVLRVKDGQRRGTLQEGDRNFEVLKRAETLNNLDPNEVATVENFIRKTSQWKLSDLAKLRDRSTEYTPERGPSTDAASARGLDTVDGGLTDSDVPKEPMERPANESRPGHASSAEKPPVVPKKPSAKEAKLKAAKTEPSEDYVVFEDVEDHAIVRPKGKREKEPEESPGLSRKKAPVKELAIRDEAEDKDVVVFEDVMSRKLRLEGKGKKKSSKNIFRRMSDEKAGDAGSKSRREGDEQSGGAEERSLRNSTEHSSPQENRYSPNAQESTTPYSAADESTNRDEKRTSADRASPKEPPEEASKITKGSIMAKYK